MSAASETAVADASVLVNLLLDESWGGGTEHIFGARRVSAPAHVDAEIMHALRRLVHLGAVGESDAVGALGLVAAMPLTRVPLPPLTQVAWSMRDNLSAYDALYVALARVLECDLYTADRRMAAAPGLGIAVKVMGA